jgi:hypothetical protein
MMQKAAKPTKITGKSNLLNNFNNLIILKINLYRIDRGIEYIYQ